MNYYNEFDPKAAAWIRELIADGLIAPGVVDERSITEIQPEELSEYVQCHFFAGVGGWPLAFQLAGIPDEEPAWTGSCPCQPFSAAGAGKGESDERHLWPAFFRLIEACGPRVVYGEQVASAAVVGGLSGKAKRGSEGEVERVWLDGVFADLETAHYACGAVDLPAAGIGAPHIRQRAFWVAYAASARCDGPEPRPERDSRHETRVQLLGAGGPTGRLADSERAGLEGHARNGDDRNEPGRERAHAAGSTAAGGCTGNVRLADTRHEPAGRSPGCGEAQGGRSLGNIAGRGAWGDFDIIPCRDGKARRIESGTFPLVDGLPKGVVPSGDPSLSEVQATAEARQMRLRGYGNAIAPDLAAQFITACREAIQDLTPTP